MVIARAAQVTGRGAQIAAARLLPRRSSDSPLWLFGGASGRSYSDNARSTHERVLANRSDVHAVWVIDPGAVDRDLVARRGAIATRGSFAAQRSVRSADVIVFSHGIQDVPGMMWADQAVRVRLGHGLTAFGKTKGRTPRSVARMIKAVDLAPVASPMERAHKAEWGFAHGQLPITGLARWDTMLAERRAATPRERPLVLYAPTSRPWHTAQDASPEGALKPVHELLKSARLRRHLEDGSFELGVYFHQITRYRFGTFNWLPEGVHVIEREADLPHLIATAALVISDYSSILWDALYLDTPVVFFQFDRHEHVARRGSYLDLDQPLFGPNATNAPGVIDAIDEAVGDGFLLHSWQDQREAWQDQAFTYRDAGNAQRVIAAIEESLRHR